MPAKRPERLPVVLAKSETTALLGCMAGLTKTMAYLLYGSGFRLFECLRLRVKDIDFERHRILVRDGKGRKDRVVPLPSCVTAELRDQLKFAQSQHECHFAAPWVHWICRIMGPGEHGETTSVMVTRFACGVDRKFADVFVAG